MYHAIGLRHTNYFTVHNFVHTVSITMSSNETDVKHVWLAVDYTKHQEGGFGQLGFITVHLQVLTLTVMGQIHGLLVSFGLFAFQM